MDILEKIDNYLEEKISIDSKEIKVGDYLIFTKAPSKLDKKVKVKKMDGNNIYLTHLKNNETFIYNINKIKGYLTKEK